ncbi:hypothetical protein Tco_1302287 [Tanacetum coccineum]
MAPSPSNSQTTPKTQPPVIPNDVEEENHDIEVAHMGNDPYFAFADADHASMQFLGDRLVSWSSKRQKSVAISGTEAEYINVGEVCSKSLDETSLLIMIGLRI